MHASVGLAHAFLDRVGFVNGVVAETANVFLGECDFRSEKLARVGESNPISESLQSHKFRSSLKSPQRPLRSGLLRYVAYHSVDLHLGPSRLRDTS